MLFPSNKKQKSSLVLMIIGFFLTLLTVVGFGVSSFFSVKKIFKGDNYNSVINVRYELDPYKSENPVIDKKASVDLDDLKLELDKIADIYSKYLLDKKVSNSNVKTEIIEDNDNNIYRAFINASINNYKLESSDPAITKNDDKNKDVSLALAYYANMDIGQFNVIYSDGYKDNGFEDSNLYMWNINQEDDDSLTDTDSKIKVDIKQNKIHIKLRSQYSFGDKLENDSYSTNSIKQTFYKAKNSSSEGEINTTPFMIIVHNFNGMINEMNFISFIWYQYNINPCEKSHEYIAKVRDAYFQLTDDQRRFGQEMHANKWLDYSGFIDNTYRFNDSHGFYKNIRDPLEQKELPSESTNSVSSFESSNILYALQDTSKDGKGNDQIEIGRSSVLKYEFLNKYILGIVNKDNFTDYLPDKNPTKSSLDSNGNWLTITNSSNKFFTTNQIYKSMTSQKSTLPLMNVIAPSWSESKDINRMLQNGLVSNVNVSLIDSDLNKSILQISTASTTTIIAIAILLLIIGIVVSILYRIPGLISFAWMILPIGLLPLIMFLSGFGLSIWLLIGTLITMLVSSISLICLLNKIKSNHINHKTLNQSIKFGFKHSIITILDFHAISLIAGVVMLFFSISQIFALSMSLIVGSLLSFASIFGFNGLNQMLVFGNNIGMYNFKWFSSNVYDISSNQLDKRFEIPTSNSIQKHIYAGLIKNNYISRITTTNNLSFKKKWFIPYILTIAMLIIFSLALMFGLNMVNLSGFKTGTFLMIKNDNDITQTKIMDALSLLNLKWYNFKTNSDYFSIESAITFNVGTPEYKNLVQALEAKGIINYFIQNIDNKMTIDFSLKCLWILLTFGALMSVYTLVRFNWYSILPTFLTFILTCGLSFGLIVIFHLSINIYIGYSFIMIGIMEYLFMYALISAIASKYVKFNPTLYNELKSLYTYSISLFNECSIEIIGLYAITVLVMILFLPAALILFTINILISVIFMILNNNIILPNLMYLFNNLHNLYKIRVRRIQLSIDKNNLDKIDEELINTININTRDRTND